jgi:hypothetical protein
VRRTVSNADGTVQSQEVLVGPHGAQRGCTKSAQTGQPPPGVTGRTGVKSGIQIAINSIAASAYSTGASGLFTS